MVALQEEQGRMSWVFPGIIPQSSVICCAFLPSVLHAEHHLWFVWAAVPPAPCGWLWVLPKSPEGWRLLLRVVVLSHTCLAAFSPATFNSIFSSLSEVKFCWLHHHFEHAACNVSGLFLHFPSLCSGILALTWMGKSSTLGILSGFTLFEM